MDALGCCEYRGEADHYSQPRALFGLFDVEQRRRLFANIAGAMQGVPASIVGGQLAHFDRVDPAYGAGVREVLGTAVRSDERASLTTRHGVAAEWIRGRQLRPPANVQVSS